jgi:hypothetical protein
MPVYRYIFTTLRTERVIEEIDLFGVYMDMQLNDGGTFTGTFNLDQTGKRNVDLISATIPGLTYVAVERNNVPIWAGPIVSRTYQSQSKTCQLAAVSFEHYPDRQRIDNTIIITNTEQRNIFRTLWTTMQSKTERNINIEVPSSFVNANLKSVSILATDRKYFGEIMSELADADDGFDWYIALSKSGSYYRKTLLIGYPALGTPSAGAIVLEYPGPILNYYMTDSMADAATNLNINGSGEGSSMIVGHSEQTDMYANGWPRWDIDISRKDITSQSSANGLAANEGRKRRPPMAVIKTTLKSNSPPEFGTFGLGDSTILSILDARNPTLFVSTTRMVRWELTPQSSDASEEVNYIFEGDPDVG